MSCNYPRSISKTGSPVVLQCVAFNYTSISQTNLKSKKVIVWNVLFKTNAFEKILESTIFINRNYLKNYQVIGFPFII
jgi:hypothetical protein